MPSILARSIVESLGCDEESAEAAAASLPAATHDTTVAELDGDAQLTVIGVVSARASSAQAAEAETEASIRARPARGIFSYGTLRADFDREGRGDRWGVIRAIRAEFGAECKWRYARAGGFALYQDKQLDYPFCCQMPAAAAAATAATAATVDASSGSMDEGKGVIGTLLTWPGNDSAFASALQRCNAIEGFRPGAGKGLYQRAVVRVVLLQQREEGKEDGVEGAAAGGEVMEEEVMEAYMYYQDGKSPEELAAAKAFPGGDWLAGRRG